MLVLGALLSPGDLAMFDAVIVRALVLYRYSTVANFPVTAPAGNWAGSDEVKHLVTVGVYYLGYYF